MRHFFTLVEVFLILNCACQLGRSQPIRGSWAVAAQAADPSEEDTMMQATRTGEAQSTLDQKRAALVEAQLSQFYAHDAATCRTKGST